MRVMYKKQILICTKYFAFGILKMSMGTVQLFKGVLFPFFFARISGRERICHLIKIFIKLW